MSYEFKLPDVGEGIDAAEVVTWHVAVGDRVREDQEFVEVQTDKAIVMIPCPVDGTILRLCAEEGDVVQVGEVLAVFDLAGEVEQDADTKTAPAATAAVAPASAPSSTEAAGPIIQTTAGRRLTDPAVAAIDAAVAAGKTLASPAARRLASTLGVDLALVRGSGPFGRIRRDDVLGAARMEPPAVTPPTRNGAESEPTAREDGRKDEIVPLRGTRRVIARNMTLSWQTIPHIIDFREVDVQSIMDARQTLKDRAERAGADDLARSLTILPLLAKIAATVVRRHPALNSTVDMEREEITIHGAVNLNIAISAPDGLVTPVVRDADRKSVTEIAGEIAALAAAARERRLQPAQLAGGTFTVNNYGALGSPFSTPIIPPGQSANLGFGRIQERAVVRNGAVVARPIVICSCSADHRVVDGEGVSSFMNEMVETIENPILLLAELA